MLKNYTNRTLEKLRAGQPVVSVWLGLGSEALAEIAAEAAPDAIILDAQHGLWDVRSTHAALGMIAHTSTPIVRVANNSATAIGFALDAGAQGVIVPLVETARQAARAVSAAHYPPKGERSGGGVRPLANAQAYWESCSQNILVSVMIETALGLENVADIAAVPGVDLIFIGTGDLLLSLGFDADIEAAIQTILAAARAAHVPCGIFTINAEAARARLAQGFAFVVAENDLRLAREGIAASLAHVSSKDTL
jgi:2-keto-3-deoxy-L-rhamnonate aldolase RhmA